MNHRNEVYTPALASKDHIVAIRYPDQGVTEEAGLLGYLCSLQLSNQDEGGSVRSV